MMVRETPLIGQVTLGIEQDLAYDALLDGDRAQEDVLLVMEDLQVELVLEPF